MVIKLKGLRITETSLCPVKCFKALVITTASGIRGIWNLSKQRVFQIQLAPAQKKFKQQKQQQLDKKKWLRAGMLNICATCAHLQVIAGSLTGPFFPFFLLRWRRKKALFDVDVGRLNPRNPHLASESSPVKNNFFERPVIRTTEPPWASKSKSFLFNLIVAYVNLLVKSCLTSEYKYLSLKSLRISACVMKNFPLLDPLKTFCDVTLNQTKTKWAAFVGHVAQSPLVFAALFTHSCIEGLKSRINRWCQAPTR